MALRRGARAHAKQFRHEFGTPGSPESSWTGSPRDSSTMAGRSRSFTDASCSRPLTGVRASWTATGFPEIQRTADSVGSRRDGWTPRKSATHLLSVSGRLDRTPGGPAADGIDSPKRSLYIQTARWDRSSFAMLFDAANPDSSTEKRNVSTVAPQALLFLNHPFVFTQAKHLAERLAREVPADDNVRIERAYQLLFGRSVRPEELEVCQQFSVPPREARDECRLDGPCPPSALQQRVRVRGLSRQACEDHAHVGANEPLPSRFSGASR